MERSEPGQKPTRNKFSNLFAHRYSPTYVVLELSGEVENRSRKFRVRKSQEVTIFFLKKKTFKLQACLEHFNAMAGKKPKPREVQDVVGEAVNTYFPGMTREELEKPIDTAEVHVL